MIVYLHGFRSSPASHQARQTVLEGDDHSFTHWSNYLDDIIRFAGL